MHAFVCLSTHESQCACLSLFCRPDVSIDKGLTWEETDFVKTGLEQTENRDGGIEEGREGMVQGQPLVGGKRKGG